MSIFGPPASCTGSGGPVCGDDIAQTYATKNYVNAQDDLRLPKSGGTMSGDIDLDGRRLKNVPFNPADTSDACSAAFAVQEDLNLRTDVLLRSGTQPATGRLDMDGHFVQGVLDPANPQDAATKNYVDSRKPLITVWAEENGAMNNNEYEWSFGNGATDKGFLGYTMMAAGRVLRMGLSAVDDNQDPPNPGGDASVNIVINGVENTSYGVTKPSGQFSGTTAFGAPLELAQGDRLNFRSATTNINIDSAVVSVLIELDL